MKPAKREICDRLPVKLASMPREELKVHEYTERKVSK